MFRLIMIIIGLGLIAGGAGFVYFQSDRNGSASDDERSERQRSGVKKAREGVSFLKDLAATPMAALKKESPNPAPKDPAQKNEEADRMAQEAMKLLGDGKVKEGIEKLKSVLAMDPNNQVALEELGIYYLEEGKDIDKAEGYFQKLIELNPENGLAINELSYILEEVGGLERVENFLRRIYDGNPNSIAASTGLAHVLARQGRIDEALPYLENAAKSNSAGNDVLENLAFAYLESGQPYKAVESYRKILDLKQARLENLERKSDLYQEEADDIQRIKLDMAYALLADSNCEEASSIVLELKSGLDDNPGLANLEVEMKKKCK